MSRNQGKTSSLCQRHGAFVSMSCTFPSKSLRARGILASGLHKKQKIEANLSLKLNSSLRLTLRVESMQGECEGLEFHAAALPDPRPGVGVSPSKPGVSMGAAAPALAATVGQIPLDSSISNHHLRWGLVHTRREDMTLCTSSLVSQPHSSHQAWKKHVPQLQFHPLLPTGVSVSPRSH